MNGSGILRLCQYLISDTQLPESGINLPLNPIQASPEHFFYCFKLLILELLLTNLMIANL